MIVPRGLEAWRFDTVAGTLEDHTDQAAARRRIGALAGAASEHAHEAHDHLAVEGWDAVIGRIEGLVTQPAARLVEIPEP